MTPCEILGKFQMRTQSGAISQKGYRVDLISNKGIKWLNRLKRGHYQGACDYSSYQRRCILVKKISKCKIELLKAKKPQFALIFCIPTLCFYFCLFLSIILGQIRKSVKPKTPKLLRFLFLCICYLSFLLFLGFFICFVLFFFISLFAKFFVFN